MNSSKSFFMKPLIVASLGCVLAFAVACGDDDDGGNPAPNGGTKNTGGSAGKSSGGSSGSAGKANNNGGAGNDTSDAGDGNQPDAGGQGGTSAGGAPADCVDEDDMGCYSCAPKTNAQFYNACPTSGCEPFDNSKLTAIVDGKLPGL